MARRSRKPQMKRHHPGRKARRYVGWILIAAAAIEAALMVPAGFAAEGKQKVVQLYFADPAKPYLTAEDRLVIAPDDPVAFGKLLVRELIKGSAHGNLPTIPRQTKLRDFFLLNNGTAVVDFSAAFRENQPGGCRNEQLTLFSVVNTLALNVPGIKRVKFLIDGAEAQTLAGHLTLEFPFTADMLLIR
jgi:spore germination protein GerM